MPWTTYGKSFPYVNCSFQYLVRFLCLYWIIGSHIMHSPIKGLFRPTSIKTTKFRSPTSKLAGTISVSAPSTPSFKQLFMAKTYIYNPGQNLWNNVKKSNKIGQDEEGERLGTRLWFHLFSKFKSIFTYFLRQLSCQTFGNMCDYAMFSVLYIMYHFICGEYTKTLKCSVIYVCDSSIRRTSAKVKRISSWFSKQFIKIWEDSFFNCYSHIITRMTTDC